LRSSLEERPFGRVSKDGPRASWFETREDARPTMRVQTGKKPQIAGIKKMASSTSQPLYREPASNSACLLDASAALSEPLQLGQTRRIGFVFLSPDSAAIF